MASPDTVVVSLQEKLEAFEATLTEQEHTALLVVVLLASRELLGDTEVSGFQVPEESFNMQLFDLQTKVQTDDRSFISISNILKTRHDTVKNSISNIH